MAKSPDWLIRYFGSQRMKQFSPEVVEETSNHAIVKICDMDQKGMFSKVGYILVAKSGRYNITPHESLFEGVPSMTDFFKMKSRLEKSEST